MNVADIKETEGSFQNHLYVSKVYERKISFLQLEREYINFLKDPKFEKFMYERKVKSLNIKEEGEFFHINGGYWRTPNLTGIQIGTCYNSPSFESVQNVWQLSLFPLGYDNDLDLYFEIRLSHRRGNLNAEKIRIGIAGDEGEFLTCDEFCPPFTFPLFHVIKLKFPPVSDMSYEEGLRIFLKINSRDYFEADSFNQSKIKKGKDTCYQKSKIYVEVSTQTEGDIGNKKCNLNKNAESMETSTKREHEIGLEMLQQSSIETPLNRSTSDQSLKEHTIIKSPRRTTVFKDNILHETTKKNMRGLESPDIKISTFLDFLEFRATGRAKITSQNAIELYKAAHGFCDSKLKELCRDYILHNISVENFCDVLTLSLRDGDREMIDRCDSFFIRKALDIALTSKWKIFAKENRDLSKEMHLRRLQSITFQEKYMV